MSRFQEKLKVATRLVEHRVELLGEPQPEFPSLSIFFNPHRNKFSAEIGYNYAGYFDQEAEIPVYLEKYFSDVEDLLDWIILQLSPGD